MLRDGAYNCCEHSNIDLCVDMLLVLLDEHLRTRLLDHMDSICFTLLRNCQSFPNWLWHFAFLSVQFSCSVVSDSLRPHEPQHTRPPCPSPTPGSYPNPCPLSWWCHPTISSSVVPFSSCPQCFPASRSFQMSQLFASGGQSIGVSDSTSVLPMNTQDSSPLGWTGCMSLQSEGLSRVLSNITCMSIPVVLNPCQHLMFSELLKLTKSSVVVSYWDFN